MEANKERQVQAIFEYFLHEFKIKKNVVLSKTRKTEVVKVRLLSMYFADKKVKSTDLVDKKKAIAWICGRRDRAAVDYANEKISGMIKIYPDYANEIMRYDLDINKILITDFSNLELLRLINTLEDRLKVCRDELSRREEYRLLGCA